ncbi:MAG: alpha/beta fold hydrolase [Rhodoferax sp.]|nr:alpha/beta fold hydrolase [Rhodoferax sp.]
MKPTLVLLPGLVCDRAVWAPQIQAVSARVDCHVVDYGLRDSLGAMARHVLDTAPAASFALAGHSMGGRVAMEVLRLAPERVHHLALLDTGTHPLAEGEAGAREKAGRLALLELAQSQGMRAMAAQWARPMVHPSRHGTPLFDAVLDMLARSSAEHFAAQVNALLTRPDAAPVLPTITCPTLVLTGREDLWSPPEQHARMADAIAGAQLCIVEQCGHMSTLERPETVNAAFARWLFD